MKKRILALILCVAVISAIPARGQGFALGYQYAFSGEYYSGYFMLFDLLGPVGTYANFYGIGVYDGADYLEPWPDDELAFTTDRDYWAAQSFGATFRVIPGIYLYAGYCNGNYIEVHESMWFDETYTWSYDGFYSTQEWTYESNPGFDIGVNIVALSYFGVVLGYNSSMNTMVIGFNTSLYF